MTAGEHDSDSSPDTQAPDFGQVPFFCLCRSHVLKYAINYSMINV